MVIYTLVNWKPLCHTKCCEKTALSQSLIRLNQIRGGNLSFHRKRGEEKKLLLLTHLLNLQVTPPPRAFTLSVPTDNCHLNKNHPEVTVLRWTAGDCYIFCFILINSHKFFVWNWNPFWRSISFKKWKLCCLLPFSEHFHERLNKIMILWWKWAELNKAIWKLSK